MEPHTSSISNTLDLFRIARAMQSSCFSLCGTLQRTSSGRTRNRLPGGEVIPALGHGGIEVTENVDVDRGDRILFLRVGDEMDTAERLELGGLKHCMVIERGSPPTISTSSYSLKTSRVERRVPLRIVGSSEREESKRGPQSTWVGVLTRDDCCELDQRFSWSE